MLSEKVVTMPHIAFHLAIRDRTLETVSKHFAAFRIDIGIASPVFASIRFLWAKFTDAGDK
jgi:hypothetical protein